MININELFTIASWLLIFILTGLAGSLMFINKNSGILSYTLGKSLGIVALSLITWILSLFKIISFSGLSTWFIFISVVVVIIYFKKNTIKYFLHENKKQIILIELIILSLFAIFLTIKLNSPKIEGIEKFMDIAILSNLLRHEKGVPIDTWFSPSNINYYYFGHWIVAVWAKLSFTNAIYAFNLGYASVLALVGGTIFAIVNQISKKVWAGLLAIFLALFASNLFPLIKTLLGLPYFFFDSGRFIETVINEYPYYSVVLGDLHAHMLSLLLGVAMIGALVLVILEKSEKQKIIFLAIVGSLIGLMIGTNSFDVINFGVLVFIYFVWSFITENPKLKVLITRLIAVAGPFILLFVINTLSFKPAVGGIQIALFKTPISHIIWQFGGPIIILSLGFLVILLQKNPKQYIKKLLSQTYAIVVISIATAIILILLTELFYIKDIYHFVNPPFARANTQFKIWYGVWIMLALATAIFTSFIFKYIKNIFYKTLYMFIIIFTSLSLCIGTISGLDYIRDNKPIKSQLTINGINYINDTIPDKHSLINYVNNNVLGQPIIAQAPGESYSANSWLSSYTGTASLLGWASHEWGWRYSDSAWDEILNKQNSLKKLYESPGAESLKNNLSQTGATYVLIGPDETSLYAIDKNVFKQYFGEPIASFGAYELYGPRR